MTERQTRPLADIVAEAQKRDPLEFVVTRENFRENGERDTLRFAWSIFLARLDAIRGEWSCGSAVPFFSHPGNGRGLDEAERRKLREAYYPSMATVIESLLLDFISAREHVDGWEWAKDCGYGNGSSMADIRKMVEAHPTAIRHGRFLADWFGDLMEAAEQAAIEG